MDPHTKNEAPAENRTPTATPARKHRRDTLALAPALAERFTKEPWKSACAEPAATDDSRGGKQV